ncbi:hypothetical protein HK103_001308 [Boothiomyces macroporosus]|uniref:Tetratricopeptide repeat protein n=1 Tax=Boothiomyces macroporosus TaxID=261099 RepID=A0AAD5Y104_9FUNG|nr:hypothetical protein HK103_001308 [Boothiomyces macroporosus]
MDKITELFDALEHLFSNTKDTQAKLIALKETWSTPTELALLLPQIARTYGLLSDFENGHKLVSEAEQLLHQIPDSNLKTIIIVRISLERGRLYRSSGKKAESIPFFQDAWDKSLGVEGADYFLVDAGHMMALVMEREQRLNWYEKSIAAAEKSTDKKARGWLGALYNNSAWDEHDLGNYQKALELFQKGLDFRISNNDSQRTINIAKWSVARAQRSLGRYQEALEIQEELANHPNDGYVFEELLELYSALDQKEKVQTVAKKAYELLSKDDWFVKNEAARFEKIKTLALGS